jgi:antitoxin component YwqK of YwqJK toxin-antitoxin module
MSNTIKLGRICFVLFLIFIFLGGCNGESQVDRDFYPDGTIKEERYYRNKKDREAGNYSISKYDENGLLVESGQYKNFKRDGFFCVGNMQFGRLQIYEYKNGQPNGIGKKYKSGFLTIEVLFKDSIFILERSLATFIDSTTASHPDSWGYIVYNYGPDTLIAESQGKIEFKEDIRKILLTGSYTIDTVSTDYYLDNLQDTINLKSFKEFEVDLSAIKIPPGYDYLYSELILGDLNSAYKLSDTTNVFYSEPKVKQIKSDVKSVFGKSIGHQSVTGLLNIYALDLQRDTVKEVKTYFKQVYVSDE